MTPTTFRSFTVANNVPRWDEIPFNEKASAIQKGLEFDLQVQENGGPTVAEVQKEIEDQQQGRNR
jgi:hypothetical protein